MCYNLATFVLHFLTVVKLATSVPCNGLARAHRTELCAGAVRGAARSLRGGILGNGPGGFCARTLRRYRIDGWTGSHGNNDIA